MTLAWCLYEIARNPQYQGRIREEIAAIRAKKGGEMLSTTDLDSMAYTVATMKVSWCYSPRRRAQMSLCNTGGAAITPRSSNDN